MSSKSKNTRILTSNPAEGLASMLIAAGTSGGAIASAMLQILPRLTSEHKRNNSLTKAGKDFVRNELLKAHGGAIKAMVNILEESTRVCGNNDSLVQAMDTTELYAGDRPRTSGDTIDNIEEVGKEAAIYTYDVLQQTPQVLKEDVDQCHVQITQEERPTNKTATGLWQTREHTIDHEITLEKETDACKYTYVFQKEDLSIKLTPMDTVLQDDLGRVVAVVQQNGTVLRDEIAHKRAAQNAACHRRAGLFGMYDMAPDVVDNITPKLDGEPMYIKYTAHKALAYDRKGSRYAVDLSGRFEREGRKLRSVRMLTEWVPKIGPNAKVFVVHAWQFGTPNGIGVDYTRKLLRTKNITIGFKAGEYYTGDGWKSRGEVMLPLQFPTFGHPCDGIVVHRGNNQRFIKPYRTVDIKNPRTFTKLEEHGVEFDKKRPGVLCEYVVDSIKTYDTHNAKSKVVLKYLKERRDKLKENTLENILDLLSSMDFFTWFDELETRIEDKELPEPDGNWKSYRAFIRGLDCNSPPHSYRCD